MTLSAVIYIQNSNLFKLFDFFGIFDTLYSHCFEGYFTNE